MNKKITILLVEDDRNLLNGLAELVTIYEFNKRYQIEALTALDGQEGLEILKKNTPDLIISDIMMPRMSGYELLKHVRDNPHWFHIPFIFLTAKGEDAYEGLRRGIDRYITKPYDSEDLLSTIEDMIQLSFIKKNYKDRTGTTTPTVGEAKDIKFLLELIEKEHKQLLKYYASLSKKEKITEVAEYNSFIAGIVHDLNNALGIVRNTVGFLDDELTEEIHKADLQKITLSLDYLDLILRNLQLLGDNFIYSPKWINLEEVIEQTYLILESKFVHISFKLIIDPKLKQIWFDEGQFKQLLMNLMKNSSEAMPDGGELIISTQALVEDKIKIRIRDTGKGISLNDQKRLFNENFSTKGKGRGLGLSIVRSIVEANNGSIDVVSRPNKGTTFTIVFPTGSG